MLHPEYAPVLLFMSVAILFFGMYMFYKIFAGGYINNSGTNGLNNKKSEYNNKLVSPQFEDEREVHYCPQCGNKLMDNAKYCSFCGVNIETSLTELTNHRDHGRFVGVE